MSTVAVGDALVVEGNAGTRQALVSVQLSQASARPVTVNYRTADGTATTAGGDYQAVSGKLSFAAGETTKTVAVPVAGDRLGEPDEAFSVRLSGAKNARIGDGIGVVNIADNEPRVSVSDAWALEGACSCHGPTPLTFTVSLSSAYDEPVTVGYATADGTATVADGDYDAASGAVTFAAGETSKTVTVSAWGDTRPEPDETFYLNLSRVGGNAFLADAQGFGWIGDDDGYEEPYWNYPCSENCNTDPYGDTYYGTAP